MNKQRPFTYTDLFQPCVKYNDEVYIYTNDDLIRDRELATGAIGIYSNKINELSLEDKYRFLDNLTEKIFQDVPNYYIASWIIDEYNKADADQFCTDFKYDGKKFEEQVKELEAKVAELEQAIIEKDAIINYLQQCNLYPENEEIPTVTKVYDNDLKNLELTTRNFILLFQALGLDFTDQSKFERGKVAKLINKILNLKNTRETQKTLEALSGSYTNQASLSLTDIQREHIRQNKEIISYIVDEIKKDKK